eukprot:scaffold7711_cov36-Phaeocystis_antarctica.AAC.3
MPPPRGGSPRLVAWPPTLATVRTPPRSPPGRSLGTYADGCACSQPLLDSSTSYLDPACTVEIQLRQRIPRQGTA